MQQKPDPQLDERVIQDLVDKLGSDVQRKIVDAVVLLDMTGTGAEYSCTLLTGGACQGALEVLQRSFSHLYKLEKRESARLACETLVMIMRQFSGVPGELALAGLRKQLIASGLAHLHDKLQVRMIDRKKG